MKKKKEAPNKGMSTKVEPIKNPEDIKKIKRYLRNKPMDLALFTLGINTNLRAIDLLNIKTKQITNIKPGEEIEIKEQKTGKRRRITINRVVHAALEAWIVEANLGPEQHIFRGQRGKMTTWSVNQKVKSWCKAIGLQGQFGSHTLRKTFGYMQRTQYGVDLPRLMWVFNHSSQRQTLDYLCIQPEEVQEVYTNEI